MEFYDINRNALTLRPKKAMIDWVNSIFPDNPVDHKPSQLDDEMDVFLIPEFDSTEEAREWLQINYRAFLVFALEDWCTDQSLWPGPLDWPLFERFLDYSIQSMVIDTVDEEYDEEG